MLTIRPQRRCRIPGTTARVHRNVLVRLASTIACQSSSVTSSSGRPAWPQTPPALLTRMSTAAIAAKNSATSAGLVRSATSLSTRWTTAPSPASASAIAAPMPCAVPVTTAVLPARPGRAGCCPVIAGSRPPSPDLVWSLDEIPGLRGDGQRRALRQDSLEVVRDLGQGVGGVRLVLDRHLRRQVVLPLVHVLVVRAGERLG